MQPLRDAFRSLRATPLVTAAAVVSLAIGIGANTVAFSILDAALLRPLPVAEPERLGRITSGPTGPSAWPQSVWAEIRDRDILDGTFAWFWSRFNTADRGERQFVDGIVATGATFRALALRPAIGRLLTEADDDLDAGPDGLAAVISYRFWQRRYGGTNDVLGAPLTLDGRRFTIVGVMPKSFTGLYIGLPLDVVIPLGDAVASGPYVTVMGRLKPGDSAEAATVAIQAAQSHIRETTNPYSASPYREEYLQAPLIVGTAASGVPFLERRYGQAFRILPGVVGLVLLIACGNIALLLVARTIARRQEFGIRAALGATRSRLVAQLALESLLLSASGVLVGMVLAQWGVAFVLVSLSTQAYAVFLDISPDWRVFGFASVLGILTACLCGAAPVLRVRQADPTASFPSRVTGPTGTLRLANAVVVGQVAVSLTLVVGTGLFLRTFWALASIDVGFESDRVLVATIETGKSVAPEDRQTLYERVTAAVAALPGVQRAATSATIPGGSSAFTPWIELADGTALPQGPEGIYGNRIGAGWFATIGGRVVAGREFTDADTAGSPTVAVVNEAFADRFLKDGSPLGRVLFQRDQPDGSRQALQIVGIVRNAMYRFIKELPPPTVYTPLAQRQVGPGTIHLSVRTQGPSALLLSRPIVDAVSGIQPDAFAAVRSLADQVQVQYAQERFVAQIAAVFGALAILLAGLGLYGVTSYTVAGRMREVGIRMALGGSPLSVERTIVGRAFAPLMTGLGLGLIGSFLVTPLVAPMLFEVDPRDWVTFAISSLIVATVTTLAGWIPARRAARVDPTTILKGT